MNLLMQINAFINVDLAPVHLGFTHVVDYSDSAAATPPSPGAAESLMLLL